MSKLLNKTLFYFVASAFVLLFMSAPLYYWLSEKLYLEDVDEAILLRKDEFYANALRTLKEGEISSWNRFNRDVRILPDTIKQIRETIIQEDFYDSLSEEWEPYRVLYTNVNIEHRPYTLMIRLNLVESEDLVETTGMLYLIILAVLMAGFVIVSKIISSKLWKPFYHTLSLVEQFNIEKHELPQFSETSILEFQQLNQALKNLIQQNRKAFQTQKEFTENASHELQTPLAVFQSKLDMLLQNPALTQEQAVIVQQLYEATYRLTRVSKNLLLLAKMENNQFAEKVKIDITDTLNEGIPYFSEQAKEKQIQIQTDLKEPLAVNANKGLTEILINNLLLNAIRHNINNGSVSIQTQPNLFIVSNTGTKDPLKSDVLFQRFGKISEHAGSSGLGLAIVKKIADLNNWKVNYTFSNNLHCFSVQF